MQTQVGTSIPVVQVLRSARPQAAMPWHFRRQPQGSIGPADLPYSNGLPKFYKWSLAARITRVCAAATASMAAVIAACSLLSGALVLIPWAYTFSEFIFAALAWRRWRNFSGRRPDTERDAQATAAAVSARFDSVVAALARGGCEEVEAFLRIWFHDKPLADIGRGNLKELLAYAFFHAESSAIVARRGHAEILDSMVDRLEALLHTTTTSDRRLLQTQPPLQSAPDSQPQPHSDLEASMAALEAVPEPSLHQQLTMDNTSAPMISTTSSPIPSPRRRLLSPGTTPGLRFMAHMMEPLPHFYRPWVFYASMEAFAWINQCMLLGAGFRRMMPTATPRRGKRPEAPWPQQSGSSWWGRRSGSHIAHTEGPTLSGVNGATAGGADGAPAGVGHGDAEGDQSHPSDHYYYVANMPVGRGIGATAASREGARPVPTDSQASGGDCGSGPVPIVFLHGVGMGLLPYLRLLVALAATGAPVMAFELKHVSQRWTSGHPPSLQQLAEDVVSALRRHGYSQAAVLAHSFGTAVASVLMQNHPGVVRHVTMLDPICFNMFAPRLLRNFIYRRLGAAAAAMAATELRPASPATAHASAAISSVAAMSRATLQSEPSDISLGATTAAAVAPTSDTPVSQSPALEVGRPVQSSSPTHNRNNIATGGVSSLGGVLAAAAGALLRTAGGLTLDLLMLGTAREMHCTSLLCRRVVWGDVNLWEHMVPEHCTVVLSGRDDLMCARSLERWLLDHTPATVVVHPELLHAQICLAWTRQDEVLDRMLRAVYGSTTSADGMTTASQLVPAAGGVAAAVKNVLCVAASEADASENTQACGKATGPWRYGFRSGRSGDRVSSGGEEAPLDWRREAGPQAKMDTLDVEAAQGETADVDSDVELLMPWTRSCAGAGSRRRGASLDSLEGTWGGGVGGYCGRQRLPREVTKGGVGDDVIGTRSRGVSPGARGEGAAVSPRPRRLMVTRHDSAGSYLRLPHLGLADEEGGVDGS